MSRIVVLASGTGTLLQALIDSHIGHHIAAVGSDVDNSGAIERAASAGIETFVTPVGDDRAQWDADLTATLTGIAPDLIVCAGFMRILGPEVITRFGGRVVNSHPALLPAFPGAHAVADALAYGVKVTGCTVHVVDAGVDTGPIIAQQAVTVDDHDDVNSLHERIKQVERVLLVDVVEKIVERGLKVKERSVTFG